MTNNIFNIMAFPAGPKCNLECKYCYYLNKTSLYPEKDNFQMSEKLLEEYIKQYVDSQPGPAITFGWQGGEPTLRGLDFFRRIVELEEKYVPESWDYENSFQTNGVLLDEKWCKFLAENNFLVGISIDGPAELHDTYRVDKNGQPTHAKVMKGLELLQEYDVEYNILCVVNDLNVKKPLQVYNFLRGTGAEHIQFIPLVETSKEGKITGRSITGKEYGQFLISVFDKWVKNDYGDLYIQIFEQCVSAWMGKSPGLCVFSETCGKAAVMEHNGDLYSCDHFVFPDHKLGNIRETEIKDMMASEQQFEFGLSKREAVSESCRECEYYFICHGGCLKNRNRDGLNYLCKGYQQFFNYIDPYMKEIVEGINKRQHPRLIKEKLQNIYDSIWKNIGRNQPCPCGSGRKYKKCCIDRGG